MGWLRGLWQVADPTLKLWPHQWFEGFKTDLLDAYPKTAGRRVVERYGFYLLAGVLMPLCGLILCGSKLVRRKQIASTESSQ